MRTIIEQNNLNAPYTLYKGQVLEIPRAPIHTVQKGETLYSIARRYDVDFNTLAKKNKLKKPWTLSIGQKLYLPADFNKSAYNDRTTPTQKAPAKTTQKQVKTKVTQPIQKKPKVTNKTKPAVQPLPKPQKREGKFIYPVQGKMIATFGSSEHGSRNDGINIHAPAGTAFKAVENGVVAYADNELKGFGNLILIKHADGWITAYAHAQDLIVKKGQTVKRGDIIGHVGSTGNVKTPQLHFEIRKGTKAVDPMNYLKK